MVKFSKCLLVFIFSSACLFADSISVGYLTVSPDTPDSGLQELDIDNVTGPSNCGALGLPYGACSNLDFTNWTLEIDYLSDYYSPGTPGSPETGSFVFQDGVDGYGDIGPNSNLSSPAQSFSFDLCANQLSCADPSDPDTQITSVEFSGQISPASFCLYDSSVGGCNGTTFFANPNFDLVWDGNSSTGSPYVDEATTFFAFSPDITVTDQAPPATTPEPGTFLLLAVLLPFSGVVRRFRSRS